jgi:hypothetical protein
MFQLLPALITGGVSLVNGLLGKSAADKAAQRQIDAQNRSDQITRDSVRDAGAVYASNAGDANRVISDSVQSQLEMYRPYMEAGPNAVSSLEGMAGEDGELGAKFSFGRENLDNDPGFQFILDQGQKALEQSAALKGGLFSTGTIKNLVNFKEGAANQYFNDAFRRSLEAFNTNRTSSLARAQTLQDLVRVGLGGSTAAANATATGAARIGSNTFDLGRGLADIEMMGGKMRTGYEDNKGDAGAAGIIGGANATAGALKGVSDAATKSISDWLATRSTGNGSPSPAGSGAGDWSE